MKTINEEVRQDLIEQKEDLENKLKDLIGDLQIAGEELIKANRKLKNTEEELEETKEELKKAKVEVKKMELEREPITNFKDDNGLVYRIYFAEGDRLREYKVEDYEQEMLEELTINRDCYKDLFGAIEYFMRNANYYEAEANYYEEQYNKCKNDVDCLLKGDLETYYAEDYLYY